MFRLIFVVLLVLMAPGALAEEVEAPSSLEDLDARLAAILQEMGIAGFSVALADRGSVYFTRGYGLADRERAIPMTAGTRLRAGSVSKSFTGLAAMRFVEAGRLDLDLPLSQAAPDIAFTNRWETSDPVRLVHLLEHTTGWDDIQFSEYRSFPDDITLAEGLADNPASRTSRWRPGSYESYANSGPAVLGHVLERIDGAPFEEIMDREVLGPLGLRGASFDQSAAARLDLSRSYGPAGTPEPFVRIFAPPSGALAISAPELGALVRLFLNRGMTESGPFLSPDSITRIETPVTALSARAGLTDGYGLGSMASRYAGGVWRGHSGAIDAFYAEYAYRLDAGEGFVIMVNTADGPAIREIRRLLAGYIAARHEDQPGASAMAEAPDTSAFTGVYRQINPRQEWMRPILDMFGVIRVRGEAGRLHIAYGLEGEERVEYLALEPGLYAEAGMSAPNIAAYTGPTGRPEISTGFNTTYRQVPVWQIAAPMVIWALAGVLLILAVLNLVIWCALRPFGLFAGSHRWRVWVWPSLCAIAMTIGLGAIFGGLSTDVLANFSGPTLVGRTGQLGTLLFGPLAFAGLWFAARARSVSLLARLQAGLTSASFAALWLMLAHYGWTGLTLWAYTPRIYG